MAGFVSAASAEETLESLDSLRWAYRVILVFAGEPEAARAVSTLEEFRPGVDERDIAWFVLDGETLRTNYDGKLHENLRESLMQNFFEPRPAGTAVVLIGKDGFVKSRSADLDLEETFATIDGMPMRRREMRLQDEGAR